MSSLFAQDVLTRIQSTSLVRSRGAIRRVSGPLVECVVPHATVGSMWRTHREDGSPLLLEVVGFREDTALMMPFGPVRGLAPGRALSNAERAHEVGVGPGLFGRVIDALGQPLDDRGPIDACRTRPLFCPPPKAMSRAPIDAPLVTGVRVIDGLLTLGRGQRIGLVAGSGVGKSTLLGMLSRGTAADVVVLGLVGERGREVRQFVDKELTDDVRNRCVVVAATSDESAPMRIRGANVATAIAEHFRDEGKHVLLLVDSITRYAIALREIGLSAGEPPTSRGFTPSVFSAIPRLLERAGPGSVGHGSITAVYTVLADADALDDPIVDHVRSIVDGHIVLSRKLANAGHFPPVDGLESLSRVMKDVVEPQHLQLTLRIRNDLMHLRDAEELMMLGAYTPGASPQIDGALARAEPIRQFTKQDLSTQSSFTDTLESLGEIYS